MRSKTIDKGEARADDRRSAQALDMSSFAPAMITLLAQKITASASAAYRPRFGVGITEWRIIAMLAAEPWIAPVAIAKAAGLDKAAVSRSLRDLQDKALVETRQTDPQRRRRPVALTRAGLALHDQLVALARERQERLLRDFSQRERAALSDVLIRLIDAADRL